MPIEPIASPADPRLDDYARVREPELLRARGLFIAESREVVRLLLEGQRFAIRSVLVTETVRVALGDLLVRLAPAVPVYVATREVMETVVGYNVHRGCLAAGERGRPATLTELWWERTGQQLLPVLEGVSNPDNVGGIFRNALAFGCPGVVVGPGCADPLYRKAIRVSVGATLRLPFATPASWPAALDELTAAGFELLALTTAADATPVAEIVVGARRLAVLLGNEGHGLSAATLARATRRARIPMAGGVDSLNVATSSGIALYALRRQ